MSEILREIDEELRKENLIRLWRRYGLYMIGAVVGVVVLTAAVTGWREYRTVQHEAWGESFFAAMNMSSEEDYESAAIVFAEIAEDSGAGYATLARLQEAALLARQDDVPGAVAIYEDLADSAVDQIFRDLAVLLASYYTLDTSDPDELKRRLGPLTSDDNPWRYSAIELTGFLAARTGDVNLQREIFTRLSEDSQAPSGVRARAADMLVILDG